MSREGMAWYPRYASDYITAVAGMPFELQGCYALLLDLIYDRGGPIENDPQRFGKLGSCSTRKAGQLVAALIGMGKIRVTEDGLLTNFRAEKTIEIREKTRTNRAKNREKVGKNSLENRATSPKNKTLAENLSGHGDAIRARVPEPEPDKEYIYQPLESLTGEVTDELIQRVTSWVMKTASMVVPPNDLPLVGSWLRRGATFERHIKPVVADMVGTSAGPIRSMRYFDAKIIASLTTVDVKREQEDRFIDNVLKFHGARK
ncbi:MAG: DUF1376 domain-containing protein [Pseudomonadota bacterium]|nr:DUF1376 domain-containing protein [Pseudomonadota bacterium]